MIKNYDKLLRDFLNTMNGSVVYSKEDWAVFCHGAEQFAQHLKNIQDKELNEMAEYYEKKEKQNLNSNQ